MCMVKRNMRRVCDEEGVHVLNRSVFQAANAPKITHTHTHTHTYTHTLTLALGSSKQFVPHTLVAEVGRQERWHLGHNCMPVNPPMHGLRERIISTVRSSPNTIRTNTSLLQTHTIHTHTHTHTKEFNYCCQ